MTHHHRLTTSDVSCELHPLKTLYRPQSILRKPILDVIHSDSHLRETMLWGWGKFAIMGGLWWSVAHIYTARFERDFTFNSNLFNSLISPIEYVMGMWLVSATWTGTAFLITKFTTLVPAATKSHLASFLQMISIACLLGWGAFVPLYCDMGIVSSTFCTFLCCIYSLKMHSYMVTVSDLKAIEEFELAQSSKRARGEAPSGLEESASSPTSDSGDDPQSRIEYPVLEANTTAAAAGDSTGASASTNDSTSTTKNTSVTTGERLIASAGDADYKLLVDTCTLKDFASFILLPAIVYERFYPYEMPCYWNALKRINLMSVLALVMYVYFSEKIIPKAITCHHMTHLQCIMSLLIPSFLGALMLFVFIFDGVCGILADLTGFADRLFYDDWWNSTTYEEFNRKWNKPVYTFLFKHVYLTLHIKHGYSKGIAQLLTLAYSALLHEYCLSVIFKKINVFFFLMMIIQVPIFTIQHYCMKGKLWANYFFWFGLILGLTLSTYMYVRPWAELHYEQHMQEGWS